MATIPLNFALLIRDGRIKLEVRSKGNFCFEGFRRVSYDMIMLYFQFTQVNLEDSSQDHLATATILSQGHHHQALNYRVLLICDSFLQLDQVT